jgi:hypothetical protein
MKLHYDTYASTVLGLQSVSEDGLGDQQDPAEPMRAKTEDALNHATAYLMSPGDNFVPHETSVLASVDTSWPMEPMVQIFPVDHALSPYLGALEVHLALTILLNATE